MEKSKMNARDEKKKSSGKWISAVVFSLFFSFVITISYHLTFVKPKLEKIEKKIPVIKVVPFKEYISSLKALYLDGDIDDEELRKELKRLKSLLRSQPKNVILLPDTVVLNVSEVEKLKIVSPELREKLRKYLKRKIEERKERKERR